MKTKFMFIVALLMSGVLFSSCEDDTLDLLKDLGQRKMIYILDDQEPATFAACEWINYGQNMRGMVEISGFNSLTTESNHISFYFGEEGSDFKLEAKSYSTANANDKLVVYTSFGGSDVGYNVTVVITEITDTEIKGTFSGRVKHDDTDPVKIRGAFRATQQIDY